MQKILTVAFFLIYKISSVTRIRITNTQTSLPQTFPSHNRWNLKFFCLTNHLTPPTESYSTGWRQDYSKTSKIWRWLQWWLDGSVVWCLCVIDFKHFMTAKAFPQCDECLRSGLSGQLLIEQNFKHPPHTSFILMNAHIYVAQVFLICSSLFFNLSVLKHKTHRTKKHFMNTQI